MVINSLSYSWQGFHCNYSVSGSDQKVPGSTPLVLIHPIGVGLSNRFWQRFIDAWQLRYPQSSVYNPDLLGCGLGDMPSIAYFPIDWAKQLQYLIENIIKQPVVLVAQGASFPIAIKLLQMLPQGSVQKLVLSAPPAWRTMTVEAKPIQQKLLWNLLFDSPLGLGKLFYRYARRRQFLESFSIRQLFADADQVDDVWLRELLTGSSDLQSRYAVFSFLAGFWREDYQDAISNISQPTLIIWGDQSSSISREGKPETVEDRLRLYTSHLPQGKGCIIPGRNVLPYESTAEFVAAVADFL